MRIFGVVEMRSCNHNKVHILGLVTMPRGVKQKKNLSNYTRQALGNLSDVNQLIGF